MKTELKVFFLSFVGGTQNGCCIAEGTDKMDAINEVTKRCLNPGGEMMIFEMNRTDPNCIKEIEDLGMFKFYTAAEMKERDYKQLKELSQEEQNFIDSHLRVTRICKCCNPPQNH